MPLEYKKLRFLHVVHGHLIFSFDKFIFPKAKDTNSATPFKTASIYPFRLGKNLYTSNYDFHEHSYFVI